MVDMALVARSCLRVRGVMMARTMRVKTIMVRPKSCKRKLESTMRLLSMGLKKATSHSSIKLSPHFCTKKVHRALPVAASRA